MAYTKKQKSELKRKKYRYSTNKKLKNKKFNKKSSKMIQIGGDDSKTIAYWRKLSFGKRAAIKGSFTKKPISGAFGGEKERNYILSHLPFYSVVYYDKSNHIKGGFLFNKNSTTESDNKYVKIKGIYPFDPLKGPPQDSEILFKTKSNSYEEGKFLKDQIDNIIINDNKGALTELEKREEELNSAIEGIVPRIKQTKEIISDLNKKYKDLYFEYQDQLRQFEKIKAENDNILKGFAEHYLFFNLKLNVNASNDTTLRIMKFINKMMNIDIIAAGENTGITDEPSVCNIKYIINRRDPQSPSYERTKRIKKDNKEPDNIDNPSYVFHHSLSKEAGAIIKLLINEKKETKASALIAFLNKFKYIDHGIYRDHNYCETVTDLVKATYKFIKKTIVTDQTIKFEPTIKIYNPKQHIN